MTDKPFLLRWTAQNWTRRKLLRTLPAACASVALPRILSAALPLASQKPAPVPSHKPFSTFVDVSRAAGLTAPMPYGDPENLTYIIEEMGGGCAFFDYDNDGWMDVFIVGGTRFSGPPANASNRLYKNNRDGTFTDVTKEAGLWDCGWGVGVCVGDYNNDGFEDLFITYYGQNKLYRNNGNGTFTDVTAKAGLIHEGTHFGAGCTFVDYNRDGLLDLFVANYTQADPVHGPKPSLAIPNCNYKGVPVACGPKGLKPDQHFLYRNNGDGTFTDVSKESGVASMVGSYGLTALSYDVDEDGWPDIFVACDETPSLLLLNNHDGTFREEGMLRGVALSAEGIEQAGMGVGIGDYDLDGKLDILKTHFQEQATGLYHNTGKGEFEDNAATTGIAAERKYVSWGAGIFDLDNDGYPDIFWVTGNVYPNVEHIHSEYPYAGPRLLYRNNGNGTFTRILNGEAGAAIDAHHVSRGCAFGDFDNDGDLDILIMNQNEPPTLLRNDAPRGNNWIKILLQNTKSNRTAFGATVLVHYGGKTQAQALLSQASYVSANDPRLHFGLGAATSVDIEIRWPSGAVEKYPAQAANRLVTIREGKGIVPGRPFSRT
jgi:enediyne biosynthesis protein E4